MIILGIDPGLANTGWGVVEFVSQRYRPVSFGVIRTVAGADISSRITTIASEIGAIAEKYKAEVVSMEEIFFTKNISSAISVAKVIGAITHELKMRKLDIYIYSPPQIKTAITGMGNADKNQVQQLVKVLLGLDEIPKPDHAADALADCICHASYSSTRSHFKVR